MADILTLKKFEVLSPFEIKNELIDRAKKGSKTTQSIFLNAGRGNPNWISTTPREGFFLLGQFAITECKRVLDLPPGVGGMPKASGIASRLEAWLAKHADMPGAEVLQAMVPWAVKKFEFDPDKFVHELVDSIIGDHYPVPDRMLVHNEQIVREYLQWAMCGEPRPSGTFDLYAVEGGTAAMCYIFKSLKTNRLLNPGDTIAVVTPIFTPYLEMAHLEDYGLKMVFIPARQEQRWQFTDEDLKPLLDPAVKAFFVVNPGNPYAVALSGESIRNISADHYAGAAADEIMDPRPWAEMLRQMTTFHPEFSYLPRKFKIAVIAAEEDRAAMRWHDFGLRLVKNDAGEIGFEVYPGGGMGRTPFIAYKARDFLPQHQIFSYLQAVLRVWNRHARRDNIHKQRMKILVHELGEDEFRRQVEEEFQHFLSLGEDFPQAEYDRIAAYFAPPAFEPAAEVPQLVGAGLRAWVDTNVTEHKVPHYAIVTVSLKPIGGTPGDVTAEQMRLLAELAETYAHDELRVSHEQNIILPHVPRRHLAAIYARLKDAGLATANVGLVSVRLYAPKLSWLNRLNTSAKPAIDARLPMRTRC